MTGDDNMRYELARLQEDKAALMRRIRELEAELAEMRLRTEGAERETELAYGNMQAAERQLAEERANHKRIFDLGCHHQERADKAERQLAEARVTKEEV